jgi:hypothetical protein
MNKLLDLRFVIGLFFTVIGILLFFYNLVSDRALDESGVNRWCGIAFTVFGLLMIFLSFRKDADDEILEE